MYKICHITSAHQTDDDRIFVRECSSLAKEENYDVYIIGPGNSYSSNGVTIIGIGARPKRRKDRVLGFANELISKALSLEADVYHIHDPELLRHALKLKRNGKSKVVFDSHEYYSVQIASKQYLPKICRNVVAKCYKKYENYVCKRIDAVIFPCRINGRHPFQEIAKECVLIDNVPVENEIDLCERIINETEFHTQVPVVEYTGSLSRERGVDCLIEACNRAGVKLVLAGRVYPESFGQFIQKEMLSKDIEYRGVCDRKEIMSIHASSTIGASLLKHVGQYPIIENLPTKVYEYMMMEKPFIISNFSYACSVVDKYKCGIVVDPSDVDEIVDGIMYLINNPKEMDKMGKNGREAIEREFNWNKEETKLFQLYKTLLELE